MLVRASDRRRAQEPAEDHALVAGRLRDLDHGAHRLRAVARPLRRADEQQEGCTLGRNGLKRPRRMLQREAVVALLLEEARRSVVHRTASEPPERADGELVVDAGELDLSMGGRRRRLGNLYGLRHLRVPRERGHGEVKRARRLSEHERHPSSLGRHHRGARVARLVIDALLERVERKRRAAELRQVEC